MSSKVQGSLNPSSCLSPKEGTGGNIGVPPHALDLPGVGAPGVLPSRRFEEVGLLKDGKPRLNVAQGYFLAREGSVDFEGLVEFWDFWRSFKEYLVLQRQEYRGNGELVRKTIGVKCSKRGNDVYWNRVKKRLFPLKELKDRVFFDVHGSVKETNVLFVTLTFDFKLCSLPRAWETIGEAFNRWISGLRGKYGRISYFRDWEAFVNGYPHVHVLMVFHDYRFRVFRHNGKWRTREKGEFEKGYHSFVDVEAPRRLKGAVSYVLKYLSKWFYEGEDLAPLKRSQRRLTLAMCWLFRRHSWAVSGDFFDLIRVLHNSKDSGGVQVSLDGGRVSWRVEWVFLGVYSGVFLGIKGNPWVFDLSREQLELIPDLGD